MDLKLDQFEGPLDLLLHLIKTNKIDIYDIPILDLTEQYISYLKQAESLNLDIASEFIVMASELLYIKSKMLLPIEKLENEEDDYDPRKELAEKLLDYQRYKELSAYLREREPLGAYSYTKTKEKIKGLLKHTKLSLDKDELQIAIFAMLDRLETKLPPSKEVFSDIVKREVVSVSQMSDKLILAIKKFKQISLVEAFINVCKTRAQIVATFMALLDLLKTNKIIVLNKNNEYIIKAVS
jgi:segregation and condensation protein A